MQRNLSMNNNEFSNMMWRIFLYGKKNEYHCFDSYEKWYKDMQDRYNLKRTSAKHEFLLTFKDWMCIWQEKIYLRGHTSKSYHICRIKEPGPYTIDNVYIGHPIDNMHDRIRNGNHKTAINEASHGWIKYQKENN